MARNGLLFVCRSESNIGTLICQEFSFRLYGAKPSGSKYRGILGFLCHITPLRAHKITAFLPASQIF